jgi:poly(3-hydroxybutyrate) depolymerase
MKRSYLFALAAAAVLAATLPCSAQQAPAAPRSPNSGFGAPPPSEELMKLPQTPGGKGDQQRHYFFKEAGVEMPYRLFVPQSYDATKPTPLVVALHGYSGNHNYFFALTDDLPGQLEARGFIFVAPMGYNTGSWYGAGGPATRGGSENTRDIMVKDGLSVTRAGELDVLNVLAIVQKEYNIDPKRTYLMGHSMGGAGTWYIGKKYADKWAAIAPMSGGSRSGVDTKVFAKIPVLASVGSEETGQHAGTKAAVNEINAAGGAAVYLEIEGAGHVPMIRPATSKILEFFDKHKKQ